MALQFESLILPFNSAATPGIAFITTAAARQASVFLSRICYLLMNKMKTGGMSLHGNGTKKRDEVHVAPRPLGRWSLISGSR
jgi:hypothetical protein